MQALIEGYLKPMKAHDWDRGSLYGFRAMSFPSYLDYSQVAVPVQFIHGEQDRGLKKAARQVCLLVECSSCAQADARQTYRHAGQQPTHIVPKLSCSC